MSTIKVKCPRCNFHFDVRTRAKVGEGTQRKVGWNRNRQELFMVLTEANEPLTVREVQAILYKKGVKRYRRKDKETPTGGWNYHQVQADLSLMVGNDMIKMSTGRESFDDHSVTVKPTPKYSV